MRRTVFQLVSESLLIVHFLSVEPLFDVVETLFDSVFPHRSCTCFTIHSTINTLVAISAVGETAVADMVVMEAIIVMPAIIPGSHLIGNLTFQSPQEPAIAC